MPKKGDSRLVDESPSGRAQGQAASEAGRKFRLRLSLFGTWMLIAALISFATWALIFFAIF